MILTVFWNFSIQNYLVPFEHSKLFSSIQAVHNYLSETFGINYVNYPKTIQLHLELNVFGAKDERNLILGSQAYYTSFKTQAEKQVAPETQGKQGQAPRPTAASRLVLGLVVVPLALCHIPRAMVGPFPLAPGQINHITRSFFYQHLSFR